MHVILFMAMSVNGMAADENDKEDFLSWKNWDCFCKLADDIGGFVIGRKTYEAVQQNFEGHGFDDLRGTKIIVSSHRNFVPLTGYIGASSPQDALLQAHAAGLSSLLLTGGPLLNAHFLNEKLVDEVWLNVEPVLLGKGKNFVNPILQEQRLVFKEQRLMEDQILQLRYKTIKA